MTGDPPRLTLRIAGYTAVALLFAAGPILWFVHQRAIGSAVGFLIMVELQRILSAPRKLG
jgi:hypothetical protein